MGTQILGRWLILEIKTQEGPRQQRRQLSKEIIDGSYCGASVVRRITRVDFRRREMLQLVAEETSDLGHRDSTLAQLHSHGVPNRVRRNCRIELRPHSCGFERSLNALDRLLLIPLPTDDETRFSNSNVLSH